MLPLLLLLAAPQVAPTSTPAPPAAPRVRSLPEAMARFLRGRGMSEEGARIATAPEEEDVLRARYREEALRLDDRIRAAAAGPFDPALAERLLRERDALSTRQQQELTALMVARLRRMSPADARIYLGMQARRYGGPPVAPPAPPPR